jgi:hypothetical protein
MLPSSPVADPDFFGKDDFVPFLGQVEDVNDPKQSGRVKVRCMGWHPKDKTDLPTDDLPWSRVGMPTTHAQIGRVGGKHGLLPGSWVMGFFLDGHSAQNPFVLSTFNATSNATEETNTRAAIGVKGKLDGNDRPFTKYSGPQFNTNPTHQITDEEPSKLPSSEVDKSGDNNTHNALNKCRGENKDHQSKGDFNNTEAETSFDNNTSYNYGLALGDSKCGATAHAIERIQLVLKEIFPNNEARFAFGDTVFSANTGGRVDLNAAINLASILICDIIKDSIETLRGLINDTILRPSRSTAILTSTTREYNTVKIADQTSKTAIDIANKIYTEIINNLCMFIADLLRAINNQTEPGQDGAASPLTEIANAGAQCVAETILQNTLALVSSGAAGSLGGVLGGGAANAQQIQLAVDALNAGNFDEAVSSIDNIFGALGVDLQGIDQVADLLTFITQFKFTLNPLLFNTLSIFTLDIFNQDGCNDDSIFFTSIGALKTLATEVEGGFGGIPAEANTGEATTAVCDQALGGVDGILGPVSLFLANPGTTCRADAIAVSVPSSERNAAQNFINGIANTIVIRNSGCEFFIPDRGDQILFDISSLT